jgi:hypothetical protein
MKKIIIVSIALFLSSCFVYETTDYTITAIENHGSTNTITVNKGAPLFIYPVSSDLRVGDKVKIVLQKIDESK